MRDPLERTKVVVRHLPPGITQPALMQQIESRFSGRYTWVCFRPGKNSQKNHRYSHAYIDFKRPEDVIEFAEFFDGHIFVNEKGNQFKANVEFAPSQRVPKACKQDGRKGSITRDPEYLEFLQLLAKPIENLPSAEIQLEKKEAERAGSAKEAPISTPLMDFVRQKRAAKIGSYRSSVNGKLSRRAGSVSAGGSNTVSSKRGAERRKVSASMYVLRDNVKSSSGKEKQTNVLVSRKGEHRHLDKSTFSLNGSKVMDDETGPSGADSSVSRVNDSGKKRIILMKGKERETLAAVSPGTTSTPLSLEQSSHSEGTGRMVRSILSREQRQPEQHIQSQYSEKDKWPPRPPNTRAISKDRICVISDGEKRPFDEKATENDTRGSYSSEKHDKRTRNRDRPDRGVWAPLHRLDSSHTGADSLSSTSSVKAQNLPESLESTSTQQGLNKTVHDDLGSRYNRSGRNSMSAAPCILSVTHSEMKGDMTSTSRNGETRIIVGGSTHSSSENGRHGGHRGHALKESESFTILSDGKHPKRTVSGFSSHEKQIWVQKTGSG